MQITIITGSPHKNGTSELHTDEFIKDATEAGHDAPACQLGKEIVP